MNVFEVGKQQQSKCCKGSSAREEASESAAQATEAEAKVANWRGGAVGG
jgi:hypothetical protein